MSQKDAEGSRKSRENTVRKRNIEREVEGEEERQEKE